MKRKLSAILAAAMLASSFGMSAMAEECVEARFTDYDQVNQTITVMPGRIRIRNRGVSMASPPFWRWMGTSSRT